MTQKAWLLGFSPREPPVPTRIKRCWPELNRISSGPSIGHSSRVQSHSFPWFQGQAGAGAALMVNTGLSTNRLATSHCAPLDVPTAVARGLSLRLPEFLSLVSHQT